MVNTHVWIACLMVDINKSGAATVDLTNNLSSRSAVALDIQCHQRETIRRRLTEVGLRPTRPLRRLSLTPHHRQCRLDFADLGRLGV
ncbi:hypothetical protein TNCV_3262661 [Trichonephila clavipes]|nr:hypothetical protein TNCV_3262661 [Trichonephila clavipes]